MTIAHIAFNRPQIIIAMTALGKLNPRADGAPSQDFEELEAKLLEALRAIDAAEQAGA